MPCGDVNSTNRDISEVITSMQQTFINEYGRLLSEEEAIRYVDNIRRDLREAGELR